MRVLLATVKLLFQAVYHGRLKKSKLFVQLSFNDHGGSRRQFLMKRLANIISVHAEEAVQVLL